MRHVYLVRHGEYDNPRKIIPGRLPVELSENGKQKVKRLADFFEKKQITHIYSSAVLRCKQTSEILCKGKIPITYDKRLLEGMSAYQGYHPFDPAQYYAFQEELGGETREEIQKRMQEFWDEVILVTDGTTIICSHADPIYLLYLSLLKKPIPKIPVFDGLSDYPQKGTAYEMLIDDSGAITRTAIIDR